MFQALSSFEQWIFFFNHWINDVDESIVNQMIEIFWIAPKTFLGRDQFCFGGDQFFFYHPI
jgi:hypothetical protein